jgi:hypothetical protein
MRTKLAVSGFVITAALLGGVATEKPRIFITESQALQVSGNAAVGDAKGGVSVAGGYQSSERRGDENFSAAVPGGTHHWEQRKGGFCRSLGS